MSTIGLKGASGLGDTIIAYPIVKYYAERYDTVYYMTDYPELYELLDNVECYPHQKVNYFRLRDGNRHPVDVRFTYCPRKYTPGTSQFQDSCLSAKVPIDLPLKIDLNLAKYKRDKPYCVLAAPYEPFGREDEWGAVLRIVPKVVQNIVDEYKDRMDFVQIGNDFVLHKIDGTHDLVGSTTVIELMGLVANADVTLSQIGNLLPMSEALGKKSFTIFSKSGLETENKFISSITPGKTVHYKDLNCSIIDDDRKAVEKFGRFTHLI